MTDKRKTAEATQDSQGSPDVSVTAVHATFAEAGAAAAEEAEAAQVTPSAVLKSTPEGYVMGDGATWPAK